MFILLLYVLLYYIFMYSNNLEGRQGSDLIQYSVPWEYELTNKQQVHEIFHMHINISNNSMNKNVLYNAYRLK